MPMQPDSPRFTRRRLLAALGALGIARLAAAVPTTLSSGTSCVVSPSMTEGPYFVDERLNRSDLTAGTSNTGVTQALPLTLNFNVVSARGTGCLPVYGVQVDVWHCDALGNYSDVAGATSGQTYLRGYQVTDSGGQVSFKTVYPGFYRGRTIHIHVKARLFNAAGNTTYEFNTQIFFDETVNDAVMATAPYNTRGTRDTRNAADNIYGNRTSALANIAPMPDGTAGYVATATLGLDLDPALSPVSLNQGGLSGHWYDPASAGQGFALEIYPDRVAAGTGQAFGGWFAYDVSPAGSVDKQRWYTFGGPVGASDQAASLQIYRNVGGNLNASPVTSAEVVGVACLSFSSCEIGQFAYRFTDGSARSGVIPMERLAPNVICSSSSARPTDADFAFSGNWYDPATSGQGMFIELNPNSPVLFLTWYTYAPNGSQSGVSGQRWFTAQTTYVRGARTFTMPILQTTGGIFDQATVPAPWTQSLTAGTATVTFTSCTNATLAYNFTAGPNAGAAGAISLRRLGPTPAGCVA